MSIPREEVAIGDQTKVPTDDMTRAQKKARLIQVLDRGVTHDRLKVDLPPDVYGEWVPNDTTEIAYKESLGFEMDTKYAPNRALHNRGDGKPIVGDCVFMVTSMEQHLLIEEIRREQYDKLNHKDKKQREERQYETLVDKQGGGVSAMHEGSVNEARKAELEQILSPPSTETVTT
jgi:hypothetical protein